MLAGWDIEDKLEPADVVTFALDGLEAGDVEIGVDEASRVAKSRLAEDPRQAYAGQVVGG